MTNKSKKKIYLSVWGSFLLGFLCLLPFGCQDDLEWGVPAGEGSLAVQSRDVAVMELSHARLFYEQAQKELSLQTRHLSEDSLRWLSPYTPSLSGSPSWLYYACNQNDTLLAVDVDLTDRIKQDYVLQESWEGYRKYKQLKYRRSYTRYVYTRHLQTGVEQGFFMTIVPSLNCTRNYSTRIERNTYLYRNKYLGGYVLFHNLDGTFSNGWEYKDGKITGKVLPSAQARMLELDMSNRLRLGRFPASYQVIAKSNTPKRIQTRTSGEGWDVDGGWLDEWEVVGGGGDGDSEDGDDWGDWNDPWDDFWGDGDDDSEDDGDAPVINPDGGGGGGGTSGGYEENDPFKELEEHRNYDKVLNDATVMDGLKKAWKEMLEKATENGRQEVGAWIYYDPYSTHKYYVGDFKYGKKVSGGEHGSIDLGSSNYSENGVPEGCVPLAPFHVHTTLSHETGDITKVVGPSPTDLDALKEGEFGIVVDYEGEKDLDSQKYILSAGHQDDLPILIYVYNKEGVIKTISLEL